MTMLKSKKLPEGFSALEPFVDRWAGDNTMARIAAREDSSMDEIRAFYDLMLEHAEKATDLINQYPLEKLPESVALLAKLMLGFCHATISVEVLNSSRVPTAPYPTGVKVLRGSTPFG